MSGKLEHIGSNMYALIYENDCGYEESDFGFEHELGKGIWIYNNNGKPILCLEEIKQLRDKLNDIIEHEERYEEIRNQK